MSKAAEDIDSDIEFLKELADALPAILPVSHASRVKERLHQIATKLEATRAFLREPAALENQVEIKLAQQVKEWAEGEEYGTHAAQCDATSIAALWLLQRRIKNAAAMIAVGEGLSGMGGMLLSSMLKKEG